MNTQPIADALAARPHLNGQDWLKTLSLFGAEHQATLGCLLALVRASWRCPGAYARKSSKGGWVVCIRELNPNGPVVAGPFRGATEAEALVTALEAAPKS